MIIIQTQEGEQSSSLIRAISQILIGSGKVTQYQFGELGMRENIASVIHFDNIKIGLVGQVENADDLTAVISRLLDRDCGLILVIQNPDKQENFTALVDYSKKKNMHAIDIKSSWSEKLGVNYLNNKQHQLILDEIERLQNNRQTNHQ
jgi:hypothetical protein